MRRLRLVEVAEMLRRDDPDPAAELERLAAELHQSVEDRHHTARHRLPLDCCDDPCCRALTNLRAAATTTRGTC